MQILADSRFLINYFLA